MAEQKFNQDTAPNKEKSKFFNQDLQQKVFLLIVGFILTGIVGTLLSFYFQSKTTYNNYKLGLIESERKIAKDVFEDITDGMDARVYCAQVVNDSYSFNPTKAVSEDKWSDYRTQINNWNKNINKRLDLVNLYFGAATRHRLMEIHTSFLDLNLDLNNVKNGNNRAAHDDARDRIAQINSRIAVISSEFIKRIQLDSIGRIPTIKKFKFAEYLF